LCHHWTLASQHLACNALFSLNFQHDPITKQ
jgi:hypothetical protein